MRGLMQEFPLLVHRVLDHAARWHGETEILSLTIEALRVAGLKDFSLRIGDLALFGALVDAHRAARSGGQQVLGYFHSHPAGPPEPSATDRSCAAGDGRVWAILAGDDVRFWKDGEQGFTALSFAVIES